MSDDALLPTPTPRDHHAQGAGHNPREHSTALSTLIQKAMPLLPTPTTQDGENVAGEARFRRNSLPLNALVQVLPERAEP